MADGRLVESSRAIDAIGGAFKGKRRIVEVAAATLCKLNAVMKQMKDWRDDRATLRSNIRRLRLALREVEAETSGSRAGPLMGGEAGLKNVASMALESGSPDEDIEGWRKAWKLREEDSRMEKGTLDRRMGSSEGLQRNILAEVEAGRAEAPIDRLRRRLGEFSEGDRILEALLADLVGRVADVILNLSEELVDMSESLYRSRARNEGLRAVIDELRSMLRSRCGNNEDCRKRIAELETIARRLQREGRSLTFNPEDETLEENSMRLEAFGNTEKLLGDLKNMLRRDREALLLAGDPNRSNYTTRMIELRFVVQHISVELDKITTNAHEGSPNELFLERRTNYTKNVSILEDTPRIDVSRNGRALGKCGLEGSEKYLKKLEELVVIVEEASTAVYRLKSNTLEESFESNQESADKLGSLVGKLCRGIEELEDMAATCRPSDSLERTKELEGGLARLEGKLKEREESANTLREKLANARRTFEGKVKELKDTQRMVIDLSAENETLKEEARGRAARISELLHERQGLTRRLAEMQQVKNEAGVIRGQLEDLRADKDGLLEEMERMRKSFSKESEEIAGIIAEKDARAAGEDVEELRSKLRAVSEENSKLQRDIEELRGTCFTNARNTEGECGDARYSRSSKKPIESEDRTSKTESRQRRSNLETANKTISRLRTKLHQSTNEKARLEAKVLHLDSTRETLAYQLGVAESSAEERSRELSKALSERGNLEQELESAKSERERLVNELSMAVNESGALRASLEGLEAERSRLEDRASEFEGERSALRREMSELRRGSMELASRAERTRTELADRIRKLEAVNARLGEDLGAVTLKNTEGEGRVRVLLAERNDLATRINEANEENVALRDQLNKVKGENEYFSVELNKSRIENDGAKSKNASLRDMYEEAGRENEALRRANEELVSRLRESRSELRTSENRTKLLRIKNAALEKTASGLYREIEELRKGPKVLGGSRSRKRSGEASPRGEEGEGRRKLAGNGRSVDRDDKARTKERAKDTARKLRAENEALKFELANLRVEKSEVGLELSRTKEKFERLRLELAEAEIDEGTIEPILNKLEVVNLYYRREINNRVGSYPAVACKNEGRISGDAARECDNGSVITQEELFVVPNARSELRTNLEHAREIEKLTRMIDDLSIENIALKLEAQTLRSSITRESTRDKVARGELVSAKEEILALKSELLKLRDEKESLRSKLDGVRAELDGLRSEKVALKDELVALREVNDNLRCRANELQSDRQKLAEVNTGLEFNLISVLNELNKTGDGGNLGQLEERLRNVLYEYTSTKNSCV
ncbi:hypothetical protein KM043_002081 [Ampulex compressa]|nr:hypothetical protein KM043_002081 [Ampulex compressa]